MLFLTLCFYFQLRCFLGFAIAKLVFYINRNTKMYKNIQFTLKSIWVFPNNTNFANNFVKLLWIRGTKTLFSKSFFVKKIIPLTLTKWRQKCFTTCFKLASNRNSRLLTSNLMLQLKKIIKYHFMFLLLQVNEKEYEQRTRNYSSYQLLEKWRWFKFKNLSCVTCVTLIALEFFIHF